ncbi:hypothetical protein SKAU_G00407770 [Synaphobranchus kaupii]|uniref:Uncharacterized protein n=1 Tax=Synaphobranchus kaupii TaxID=118154 RepID=A0A9Q1EAC2_SYNKA|nr:hypothetical protein SKAU_G00407770 [Synaphobranchus kaupii]
MRLMHTNKPCDCEEITGPTLSGRVPAPFLYAAAQGRLGQAGVGVDSTATQNNYALNGKERTSGSRHGVHTRGHGPTQVSDRVGQARRGWGGGCIQTRDVDISLSASLSPLAHPAALPKPLLALATITKEERHCARECLSESQPMEAPVSKGQRPSANDDATLTAGLRVEVCLGRIGIDRSARLFF